MYALFVFFLPVGRTYAETKDAPVTYLDSISEDEEGQSLQFPFFVSADLVTGEIYVIDSRSRIIIYTPDLFPVFTLGKNSGIGIPQGLTLDADGNLYVVQAQSGDGGKQRISIFNARLKHERDIFLRGFEGDSMFRPHSIALDRKGNIYVAGYYYPGILILNRQGELLEIFSRTGSDGKKIYFDDIVIDRSGKMYLLCQATSTIYVYGEDRTLLLKFGEQGGSAGKLANPVKIFVDSASGRTYVVDFMRHAISVYDSAGKYIFEFGGKGWGEGWFQFPLGVAVDAKGRILVADNYNKRVQVFKPNM
jgi:DNA-binding beta-propeller fold protein YncE